MNERGHTNSVPWIHAVCRLRKATFIQTDCEHSWYGVGVTAFIHGTQLMRFGKVALRSTKISRNWLWPVKVTLEVIKRHTIVFCWSCDEGHLKWEQKKFPSLQFTNTDRISILSTPPPNGRSMPLNVDTCTLCIWRKLFEKVGQTWFWKHSNFERRPDFFENVWESWYLILKSLLEIAVFDVRMMNSIEHYSYISKIKGTGSWDKVKTNNKNE
jgi:hypothetical protein